ncbi:MAG TPA: hypothetical protein VGR25_06890 [bacterium]|nr:hypothetical protein [bacterium]
MVPVPASAFVTDPALTNHTPHDHSDDLTAAARWSNVPGSLALNGVRGLGGGIEYALAADFCAALIPHFIDTPRPSCAHLEEALRRAMDRWAGAHPILRFTGTQGRIAAQLPPADTREPWQGFGAEIDFFALDPEAYPRVSGLGAWTVPYVLFASPLGTNGRMLPGSTITSVDIIFNARSCYHLDPGLAGRGCNHFESLALHEVGHALDLHHPSQHRTRNFDSDANPLNLIPIDCQDPTRGLHLSPFIEERAVMNRGLGEPMPVVFALTNDDLGGRNFHYPICPSGKSTILRTLAALWASLREIASPQASAARFTTLFLHR